LISGKKVKSDADIFLLISQSVTRDDGYRILVSQYKEKIYWTVRKMVGNHEDTNDIVQDVFMKIYKSIDQFNQESKLYTWIYRIAINETLGFLRKNKNHKIVSIDGDNSIPIMDPSDFDSLNGMQIKEILTMAVDRLPEKQKVVFNLRYFQEMKYQDMSQILGTSEGGLKALYHHAVKKIESYIKNYD
jgi:RNA polymerase sigma factor (sigma-70 family)